MTNQFTVLGINYGGHDTSAALMVDGQLVAACEQERYSLDKHSRKFPKDAIEDCFRLAGIGLSDVDELAFAFDPIRHINEAYLRPSIEDSVNIERIIIDIDRIRENYQIESFLREQTEYPGPICNYSHHLCHLASAYYPSGFEDALIVSYDGIGEIESGMIGTGRGGLIDVVYSDSSFPDSLGLFYSAITHYLGWKHHCDEGIVMGLATYGDFNNKLPGQQTTYKEIFSEIIEATDSYGYHINREWIAYHRKRDKWVSDKFTEVFGLGRDSGSEINQHHMDIAAGLQDRLETIVVDQLKYARDSTRLTKLCLSGGVALNCSMNGKIEQSEIFDEMFVQPASGDSGVAVGACFLASKEKIKNLSPIKEHNYYLGSGFDNGEIEQSLESKSMIWEKVDNIFSDTATLLAEGKIVGWFQNRAEFGPRALGNRSILTRPYPDTMKDYLNDRVKFREGFRPFAPAILYEYLQEYFEIKQESPHMLIASQATPRAREAIPAVVHVDNSCRVQSVKRSNNSRFYELLSAFHQITNCPVLLNTSFNVKGQPIVNTPDQAIDCFMSTNIDCLVLGDFLLVKE